MQTSPTNLMLALFAIFTLGALVCTVFSPDFEEWLAHRLLARARGQRAGRAAEKKAYEDSLQTLAFCLGATMLLIVVAYRIAAMWL